MTSSQDFRWADGAQATDASDVEVLDGGDRSVVRRLVLAVVVIAAVVAAGVWYDSRPAPHHPLAVTFGGNTVSNAGALLTQADALFTSYVRVHGGAVSKHGDCFYNRVGGTSKSDVASDIYCGPVLFFLGKAPALYMRFALSSVGVPGNGTVLLNVALQPETPITVALPNASQLERPDGLKAPVGADGVVAPGPPPAPTKSVIQVTAADLPKLTPAPTSASIVSTSIAAQLVRSGFVPQFGRGVRTMRPAAGYKSLAFELHLTSGDFGPPGAADLLPRLQAVVDGVTRIPIPLILDQDSLDQFDSTEFLVASVPLAARTIVLDISDNGIDQTMSLLDGSLGANNIAVYQRSADVRYQDYNLGDSISARITFGGGTTTGTYPIQLLNGNLDYFAPGDIRHASGVDRAYLNLYVCSTAVALTEEQGEPNSCFPLGPSLLTLTPTGGVATAPTVFGPDNYVFDVPADFTSGTLTVRGTLHLSNGKVITVTHPISFKVTIP